MHNVGRRLAFVLASSNHGTMIVNRFDYRMVDEKRGYGVGYQILENACFDPNEVKLAVDLLALRRSHFGDGVVAIDCGCQSRRRSASITRSPATSRSTIASMPLPRMPPYHRRAA